jgi:hypothetical protein
MRDSYDGHPSFNIEYLPLNNSIYTSSARHGNNG